MSRFLKKIGCEDCGSKDNLGLWQEDNGQVKGFCFTDGCGRKGFRDSVEAWEVNPGYTKSPKKPQDVVEFDDESGDMPYGTSPNRGISREVAEFFGVQCSIGSDGLSGEIHYPYHQVGGGISKKIRVLPKDFKVSGGLNDVYLFGQSKFAQGGRTLVITEGEEDTLAIAQANQTRYQKIYPVVSIPSATNMRVVADNLSWIQSFKEVVLWMDDDDAGAKALEKMAKMIGYAKVKVAKSMFKDASDTLREGSPQDVINAIFNAQQYNPRGILRKEQLRKKLKEFQEKESLPYPLCFAGLNAKTQGMRTGEITLFTSGTGAGKSTMAREVVYDILQNTDDMVGIIALEESPAETAKKMAALALNKPSASEFTEEEIDDGFERVFGDDRVLVLDHAGAITESLTAQLNYMASVGCKYILVDHITILASEGTEGLSGNEAVDKIMNELLQVVKVHDVWIGLISHLRKTDTKGKSFEQGKMPNLDDIKGSGSIKQISMDVIAFSRNSEDGENEIRLKVLKCRHTGKTGPAGSVVYDSLTGRLECNRVDSDVQEEDF